MRFPFFFFFPPSLLKEISLEDGVGHEKKRRVRDRPEDRANIMDETEGDDEVVDQFRSGVHLHRPDRTSFS